VTLYLIYGAFFAFGIAVCVWAWVTGGPGPIRHVDTANVPGKHAAERRREATTRLYPMSEPVPPRGLLSPDDVQPLQRRVPGRTLADLPTREDMPWNQPDRAD
jgi:hypothetical protein